MQVMMGGLQGVVFAQNALCSAREGKYQVALSANEGTHRSSSTMLV